MKKPSRFSLVLILAVGAVLPASAQVTLTRILEGDIAEDTAYFWGCGWGDYDQDGNVDLFVSSGPANSVSGLNRLYRNNGNGTFARVTGRAPVNEPADSGGSVWGDFDNDGDLDLFASNYGSPTRDFFYRNEGDGTFIKITQGAWVTDSGNGTPAAWGDYDNDGYLDLYVGNSNNGNDFLYHNNRDGTMTRITAGPVSNISGNSVGCAWADYDGDGDLDLLVGNIEYPGRPIQKPFHFRNDGGGVFTRILTSAPAKEGGNSAAVSWGDYDNDGDLDLFLGGGIDPGDSQDLFRNDGPDGFVRVTESAKLEALATIGGAWGDYDNDGYLDLFAAIGGSQNNCLYHNEGDGTFAKVTDGAVVNDGGWSWGSAWADYDNDGDLDLFVANGGYSSSPGESNFLYRNDGGTNNWILVRLVGTVSNRSAIGAKLRVKTTIKGKTFWQLREISGGSGYCSQNDLRAHFGLGDATRVEVMRIEWPSGIVQELTNVASKAFLTVSEPARLQALGLGTFSLQSWKGQVFEVQASSDLTRWQPVATVTNVTGTLNFSDASATPDSARFYRAAMK
ncbi:MAG: CRTAC1 family protein [Verrucomicrobiia bacterium]